MIPEKTNRILLWFNLIVILIISSAVITFIIMKGSGDRVQDDTRGINSVEILRTELGLSDDQYRKVLIENDRTLRTYNLLLDMMCETNVAMIEELAKKESDQAVLDSLARKIGTLNTSLRRQTSDYFMQIKNLCDDEQQRKLALIFKKMMQLEEQCETCNKKDCPRKERIDNIGKY
jgi:hypothetical protein